MLQYFAYEHLSPKRQEICKAFSQLAWRISDRLQPGPERTVCLRKLLESRDAALRAVDYPETQEPVALVPV